ncbi:MAG TPA: hypothetical protein PLG58_05770, partial [Flexilinea sp.]|nr:hypothetical protein [Flexilinea sp.]
MCPFFPRPLGEGQSEGRVRKGTCLFFPRPLGEGQGEGRFDTGHVRFPLARWERVRVREEFG